MRCKSCIIIVILIVIVIVIVIIIVITITNIISLLLNIISKSLLMNSESMIGVESGTKEEIFHFIYKKKKKELSKRR